MPPLITATAKVHSADENQVGAKNGGGIYRWPEFDSRAGVSRLQPYNPGWLTPVAALGRQLHPKKPAPLEPNRLPAAAHYCPHSACNGMQKNSSQSPSAAALAAAQVPLHPIDIALHARRNHTRPRLPPRQAPASKVRPSPDILHPASNPISHFAAASAIGPTRAPPVAEVPPRLCSAGRHPHSILKAGAAGIEFPLKEKHVLTQLVMGAAAAQRFSFSESLSSSRS